MATEYAIIIRPVTRQQHEPSPNVMLHSQFKYRNKNDEIKNKKKTKGYYCTYRVDSERERRNMRSSDCFMCLCLRQYMRFFSVERRRGTHSRWNEENH